MRELNFRFAEICGPSPDGRGDDASDDRKLDRLDQVIFADIQVLGRDYFTQFLEQSQGSLADL